MKRRNIIDEVMNEHIPMPGCPQLIVTRAAAWQFLAELGYDQQPKAGTRGPRFDTVDYMVMSKKPLNEPLSDLTFRDHAFEYMRANS